MKKRILSMFLAVVMVLSLMPAMSVPAEAAGVSFTLNFKNGQITNLDDFNAQKDNITSVVLKNNSEYSYDYGDYYVSLRVYAPSTSGMKQVFYGDPVHRNRSSDPYAVPAEMKITSISLYHSSGSEYYFVELRLAYTEVGFEYFNEELDFKNVANPTKTYTKLTSVGAYSPWYFTQGRSTMVSLTDSAKSAGYEIKKVEIIGWGSSHVAVSANYKAWRTDKGSIKFEPENTWMAAYEKITISGINSDSVTVGIDTGNSGWQIEYPEYKVYYGLHTHTYSNSVWSSNGTHHWHQCTASYCTNRTGSIKDKAAHTGGAATCTAKAKCSTCGAEYGSAGSHNWGYTASGNVITATCSRVNTHKATLTLTASDSTYNGAAKPATIGNWTGTTAGLAQKPTTVTYKQGGTTLSGAPTNAGSYTASITVGTATATKAFTIAKANLSPTVTLNGWTYGGTENNPSVSGNTGNGTVTYEYKAQGAEDSTYTATQPTDAGNYTVKASIAATTNYNAATATANFTIAKANATLTPPTANNRTYDGSEQALVSAGTNVEGGTLKYRLSDGDYSENIPTATNAGTYTVYYKVFGDDANYNDTTEASVPVTIAKADPTVTPPQAVQGLVYTGTPQALVTAGSAVGGTMEYMEYSTDGQNYTDSVPVAIDAGTYTVWYKVKGDANHNDTNPVSVEVTIGKATAAGDMITETAYLRETVDEYVVIELEPLPDKEATYGAVTNNNTEFFTLSGLTLAETGHGYITATCVQAWTKGSENAKTFTVPVTNSENYNDYVITVSIEMVDHPVQTITGEEVMNVTYGDNVTVSVTNTTDQTSGTTIGAIQYSVLHEDGGDSVASINASTGALTIHKIGTVVIKAKAERTDDYAPSEPHYITVHVAPKALTEDMLTLETSEFPYDGGSHGPAFTVKDGETTLTHTDYGVDITSTTSAVNAGTYTIKIDGIGNYTGSVEKTWEIQKADASVTTPPTANDRTYDGTAQALVNAGTNVVGGTLKYSTSKTGTYSTDIPTATNAGTYTVWYKVEGDHNHNDVAATKIPVTIAKATTITTPPTAGEITYGQTLSASTLTGGVASTYGSFAWEEPGTAPVVSDSDTTNYTVVFTPDDTTNYKTVECDATLTVNKKPVDRVIDITAPKAKETAQTELAATDDFEAATITWSPELKDGKFEYNKEYIATVTLELKDIYNTTIDDVTFTVDGAKADGVTINGNTLKVVFTNTGSAPGSPSNSITAPGSAENGEVSVDKKSASAGQTVTITVTPDKGYTLETLTVTDAKGNEVALTKVDDTTYTFKMPNGKVNVDATFMEDNTMLNYFVDVPVNEYYYDAVLWAVSNGITNGTDDTHFSPNMGVTRAHVVTFLWRAAGCPEPKGDASQFTDVVAGEYYEKAVAWAIENGITKGTSATTFSPDAICTRGQIVTFLARFAGVKDEAVGYTHGFTDVNAADYFNNAVAWAKDNKITEGTTATTFSPYEDCTRAQVVTFLYRLLNK